MGRMILGLFVFAAMGCGGAPPPEGPRPNVLLVVIDTLRADRLGAYGNTRGLTPFLDELAARGHVVRHARAQAPWTNPSVASIFTSRFQSQHRIVDYGSVLAEDEITLAEALKSAGYVTGGFSANGLIGVPFGFGQGFDRYEVYGLTPGDDPAYLRAPRRARDVASAALDWLDGIEPGGPVFLYVHFMEPHSPYVAPVELLDRVRGSGPPVDQRRASETMFVGTLVPVEEARLREAEHAYDASVMAVDAALREFFEALGERGFLANAVVVITADHGEEFQEHGRRGHGKTLFDETIHVPLIVVAPDGRRPGVVEEVASSVDIAPTVLALAGVPVPARFAGRSLADALDTSVRGRVRRIVRWIVPVGPPPASYSELLSLPGEAPSARLPHERALALDRAKVIASRDGTRAFYALDRDPGEQAPDVVPPSERERLEAELAAARARAERDRAEATIRPPDAKTQEALRALGYVE